MPCPIYQCLTPKAGYNASYHKIVGTISKKAQRNNLQSNLPQIYFFRKLKVEIEEALTLDLPVIDATHSFDPRNTPLDLQGDF